MYYHYGIMLVISIIIFSIIFGIKRERALWIFLLCLGSLPFISLFYAGIYAVFNGSGLVGDYGGIDSGLFVIIMYFIYKWYVYIPALFLLVISFYKVFIKK